MMRRRELNGESQRDTRTTRNRDQKAIEKQSKKDEKVKDDVIHTGGGWMAQIRVVFMCLNGMRVFDVAREQLSQT